jgi:hypothetical protein
LFSNSFLFQLFVSGCAIYVTSANPALKHWEASHERKQLARALERAEDLNGAKRWKTKGDEIAIKKRIHY